MAKVNIVFWTQSGNTQAMAEAMAEGVKAAGAEANAVFVSDDILAELKDAKVFALGCPAMGDEVLEESEMEPFVAAVEGFASGKTIALFGSYGWGEGKWMTDWVDRMKAAGATVLNDEGIICNGEPDDDIKAALEAAGKALAGLA